MPLPSRAIRAACAAALCGSVIAVAPVAAATGDGSAAVAATFNGTATAGGTRITVTSTDLPLTSTPVDGGGPTAIADADSFNGGDAYASFPDPGQFVVSLPSLALGLLSSGVAGLPGINLPIAPPAYPFAVTANSNNPKVSAGDGAPYEISAESDESSSTATAIAGLQVVSGVSAALITSNSTVGPTADGGASAVGTTELTGLSVGPLTIGRIVSTATETMDADGVITPTTDMHISGATIGSLPIEISPTGISVLGTEVPLPIESTINKLLGAAKIKVSMIAARNHPKTNQIEAPALKIVVPFDTPYVKHLGKFDGNVTLIIGDATAMMTGQSPDTSGVDTGTGAGTGLGSTGGVAAGGGVSGDTGAGGLDLGALPDGGSVSGAPAPDGTAPVVAGSGGEQLAAKTVGDQLNLESLYLMLLVAALIAGGLGVLIQRSGLRPWTATRS